MKRLFILSGVVSLIGAAFAYGNPIKAPWGPLVPSPTPTSYDEFICDNAVRILPIYIIYTSDGYSSPLSITGVEFSAPKPSCFTGVWLSDTNVFAVVLGNSQTGVSIGFGLCKAAPFHVMTINYFASGTTPADCVYRTLAHPYNVTGNIEVADCDFNSSTFFEGANFINPPEADCFTIPVQESTWGKVKSVFSD